MLSHYCELICASALLHLENIFSLMLSPPWILKIFLFSLPWNPNARNHTILLYIAWENIPCVAKRNPLNQEIFLQRLRVLNKGSTNDCRILFILVECSPFDITGPSPAPPNLTQAQCRLLSRSHCSPADPVDNHHLSFTCLQLFHLFLYYSLLP